MKRKLEEVNEELPNTKQKLNPRQACRLKNEYLSKTAVSNEELPHFPSEIWIDIFSYLSKSDIRTLQQVCFSFYLLIYHHQLLSKATLPATNYAEIIADKGAFLTEAVKKHLGQESIILKLIKILQNGAVLLDAIPYGQNKETTSIIAAWKDQDLVVKSFKKTSEKNNAMIQLKNGLVVIRERHNQLLILDPATMESKTLELPFNICNFIQLATNEIYILSQDKHLYHIDFDFNSSDINIKKIVSLMNDNEVEIIDFEMEAKLLQFNKNNILIFLFKNNNKLCHIFSYELDTQIVKKCNIESLPINNQKKFSLCCQFFVKKNHLHIIDSSQNMFIFSFTNNEFKKIAENINIANLLNFKESPRFNKTIPFDDHKYLSIVFRLPTYYLATWSINTDFKQASLHSLIKIPGVELNKVHIFSDLGLEIKEDGNIIVVLPSKITEENSSKFLKEIIFFHPDFSLQRYLSAKDQQKEEVLKLAKNITTETEDNEVMKARKFVSTFFKYQQNFLPTTLFTQEKNSQFKI